MSAFNKAAAQQDAQDWSDIVSTGTAYGISYLQREVEGEYALVEVLRRPDRRASEVVVGIRPPRPSKGFEIADAAVEAESTEKMNEKVLGYIRKCASDLRWQCIEELASVDVKKGNVDLSRLHALLVSHMTNEQREQLALELMAKVERLSR